MIKGAPRIVLQGFILHDDGLGAIFLLLFSRQSRMVARNGFFLTRGKVVGFGCCIQWGLGCPFMLCVFCSVWFGQISLLSLLLTVRWSRTQGIFFPLSRFSPLPRTVTKCLTSSDQFNISRNSIHFVVNYTNRIEARKSNLWPASPVSTCRESRMCALCAMIWEGITPDQLAGTCVIKHFGSAVAAHHRPLQSWQSWKSPPHQG